MSFIGHRIGHYEVISQASIPETGDWYLARRQGSSQHQPHEVFLRLLPKESDPDARARLQLDFEALRGLDDERIPRAVSFFESEGAISMAAVKGVPLSQVVGGRKEGAYAMDPATLLDIMIEISGALQHAHQQQRHHGHLSADCVWLGAKGEVWVFGFASPMAAPPDLWMPPERARGRAHSSRTDQWSLAALTAALVTGRRPWDASSSRGDAEAGDVERLIRPVETQWPALGRALRKMMRPRPADRFPSFHAVREEFLKLARRAKGPSQRRNLARGLHQLPDASAPATDAEEVPSVLTPAHTAPEDDATTVTEHVDAPEHIEPPAPTPTPIPPATPDQDLDASPFVDRGPPTEPTPSPDSSPAEPQDLASEPGIAFPDPGPEPEPPSQPEISVTPGIPPVRTDPFAATEADPSDPAGHEVMPEDSPPSEPGMDIAEVQLIDTDPEDSPRVPSSIEITMGGPSMEGPAATTGEPVDHDSLPSSPSVSPTAPSAPRSSGMPDPRQIALPMMGVLGGVLALWFLIKLLS